VSGEGPDTHQTAMRLMGVREEGGGFHFFTHPVSLAAAWVRCSSQRTQQLQFSSFLVLASQHEGLTRCP